MAYEHIRRTVWKEEVAAVFVYEAFGISQVSKQKFPRNRRQFMHFLTDISSIITAFDLYIPALKTQPLFFTTVDRHIEIGGLEVLPFVRQAQKSNGTSQFAFVIAF